MTKLFDKNYKVFLIFLVLGFGVYANVIKGGFLFDDEHFIQKNQFVKEFSLKKIYSSSVTEGAGLNGNFYRPNQQLAYAVLYKIFGEKVEVFHVQSILFHILNASLLFLLFLALDFNRTVSLVGSLLFLLHPIQTEAVSYISGFADPLSLAFMLSGALLFVRANKDADKPSLIFILLSLLCVVGALFTKESTVVFLPLVALVGFYLFIRDKVKINAQNISYLVGVVLLTGLYMVGKFTIFKFSESAGLSEESDLYTENLHIRIITFLNVMPEYLKMFVFPAELNYEKPYTAYTTVATSGGLFSLLMIAALILTAVYHKKVPKLFLGLAWFFCALAPFTGIVPLNAMYLEHWIYVPIIGLIILVMCLFEFMMNKKLSAIFLIFFTPLMLLAMGRTFARNQEWGDIEKFYKNELKYTGDAVRIYNNLGMYYADKGEYNKAINYYNKAVSEWDKFPQPHHNLAGIYLELNRPEEALMEVNKALRLDPNFIYSLDRGYKIYSYYGEKEKAEAFIALIQNVQNGGRNSFEQIDAIMRWQPKQNP